MEREAHGAGTFAAALLVTIVCLALANFVVAWLAGLADVEAGTPAAAAANFVQGLAGALLAAFASLQMFKSLRPADLCLKWIVILFALLFAALLLWALVTGKSDQAMNWTTYGGIAALIGTELGRRLAKGLFRRPAAQGVPGSPS